MLKKLNNKIALTLSAWFSTMVCFWAFCVLALLPVVWPASLAVVQFVSSGFLQLVALPLLAVSQDLLRQQQAAQREEAKAHRDEIVALHAQHAKEMQEHTARLTSLHAKIAAGGN